MIPRQHAIRHLKEAGNTCPGIRMVTVLLIFCTVLFLFPTQMNLTKDDLVTTSDGSELERKGLSMDNFRIGLQNGARVIIKSGLVVVLLN